MAGIVAPFHRALILVGGFFIAYICLNTSSTSYIQDIIRAYTDYEASNRSDPMDYGLRFSSFGNEIFQHIRSLRENATFQNATRQPKITSLHFRPDGREIPLYAETADEKIIHLWAQRKFKAHWEKHRLRSCVNICGKNMKDPLIFRTRKPHDCDRTYICSYAFKKSHSNKLSRQDRAVQATCINQRTFSCPRAAHNDCAPFAWIKRRVKLQLSNETVSRAVLDLIVRSPRSFRVQSSLAYDTKSIFMVSFYLPNSFFEDKCNQLYCIYSDIQRNIFEIEPARPGDASFTYCPRPSFRVSNTTTVQLAYNPDIMSIPAPLVIKSPVTKLQHVRLSICSIVRKEADNLVEWVEFHRMMGYERFILYDNNDTEEPDETMDRIVEYYNGTVIKREWKTQHSQTEAYTDCINRYSKTTEWMSLIDVDEFIVPHPMYGNVSDVITAHHKKHEYVHINWVTFGPCGDTARKKDGLIISICHKTTKPSSHLPKSMVKVGAAAGMQNYSPHFVRMKKDIGRKDSSVSTKTKWLKNYHYRYRTYPEFISRRTGPRAGRALIRTKEELDKEWKQGLKYSRRLKSKDNWILRFRGELEVRVRKVYEELGAYHK